jgi:hypothetical protein
VAGLADHYEIADRRAVRLAPEEPIPIGAQVPAPGQLVLPLLDLPIAG